MKSFFLRALSKALNKVLALDPESFEKLKKLHLKTIQLEITEPAVLIFVELNQEGVRVFAPLDPAEKISADIVIKGSALELVKLSQQAHFNLYESQVKITGDMVVGDAVRKIFSQLDLDWEGGLAEYTGEVAAHHFGKIARASAAWFKRTSADTAETLKEYTQEEIRVLPTRLEMNQFVEDVKDLRNDVDRLAARLSKLAGQRDLK